MPESVLSHTIHRNLLWLTADAASLDLLLKDPTVARMLAVRVSPELAGFRRDDQAKLEARLTKLGHAPAREGQWT
ncbi:MAG TPA: hypothetical protein PKY30_03435 [Myxococcota bacterium]|nr:hypothetical protein [Myxococcota bacterium]HNH46062.1 hypothetical protein [Myxococcota bacterium]